MKIELNYEQSTGAITDNNGIMICIWPGLEQHETKAQNGKGVEGIVKLKDAGFTTEDIIALKSREII